MSEPTTEAGRELLRDFEAGKLWLNARPRLRRAAIAIEAEAVAIERARIAAAVEALPELDGINRAVVLAIVTPP